MSSFFERFKDEYIANLFRVSTEGAWEKWIEFCLNGTIQQATDAATRCEKLGNLKKEMLDRVRADGGGRRTELIVEMLFSNPIIQVSDLARRLKKTYPTTQSDVDRLVKANILKPMEDFRPKSYFSPEIMEIAYREEDFSNLMGIAPEAVKMPSEMVS